MNTHFLKLNPDKTEIICFFPDNINYNHTIRGTFLDGDCIRFSNTIKNLGFNLDRFLKMDQHVNSIVSHSYKLLGDVARNKRILSDKDTESLVHVIVSSRLDYCNSLFYGVNKSVINKLQKLQTAAARLISKCRKRQWVRDVLYTLHWIPVEKIIIFQILGLAPENLSN